jgi:UDP-N-acetylglucosamine 2-epimerase (non-hydrolysing)
LAQAADEGIKLKMEPPIQKSALKVMTLVGTRPELIKLSRVIPLLDKYMQHTFVHTGQNYSDQLSSIFFEELNIRKPDFQLDVASDTAMKSIAQVLEKTDEVLDQVRPDALLVLGDTNSALAVLVAKRKQIPVFHLEAGNRCFDDRTPEEVNRRIIDHISDINIAYSEHARQNLVREGLLPDRIFCIGSPMKEIFDFYRLEIVKSQILSSLSVSAKKYVVVSLHREENVDNSEKLKTLIFSLEEMAKHFDIKILFSTHPRTKERLKPISISSNTRITFLDPLGFFDFVKLQRSAFCVVSDSGTLTEEASLLGFPAVTLRNSHERPEGSDVGTLLMSDANPETLVRSVSIAVDQHEAGVTPEQVKDYLVNDFSWRVLKIVSSYVGYVNKRVWFK